MTTPGSEDTDKKEERRIWDDHDHRQDFEHQLLNRKTVWLLSTQAILFAAYGVTFGKDSQPHELDHFRTVMAWTGLTVGVAVLIGVAAIINSKLLSWRMYRRFFRDQSPEFSPPKPIDAKGIPWGVNTINTIVTLAPDLLLPPIFIVAWASILV
jgi:hypothetical protein